MAKVKSSDEATAVAVSLDATVVFGATVQLPMFDKAEPDAWFLLADANFNLQNMTDPRTKYWYVLSKFDPTTLRKLSTFLKEPRGEDPYQELREKLCETFEPPMEQKLDAFLTMSSIRDERPFEFGLELERLTMSASMDDMRKRVFVRCLLATLTSSITGSLTGKFRDVVKAADRTWTAAAANAPTSMVSAVVQPSAQQKSARCGRRGGRQRGGGSASGRTTTLTLCDFHKKFGDAARRCAPNCSRWGEERPRGPPARVFHVEEDLDGDDSQVGTALEN